METTDVSLCKQKMSKDLYRERGGEKGGIGLRSPWKPEKNQNLRTKEREAVHVKEKERV